jgi:hypothetical protein
MPANWTLSPGSFNDLDNNQLNFSPVDPSVAYNCTQFSLDTDDITPASRKNRFANDPSGKSYLNVTTGRLISGLC